MPDDRVVEEHVLQHLASADVVHNLAAGVRQVPTAGNDADMPLLEHPPGDDVAGVIVVSTQAARQRLPVADEEGGQIEDPPVVDVRIRPAQPPLVRVGEKMRGHVLVHQHLQIDPEPAIGAHDHIGANAAVGRHVAVGIGNLHVGGIVDDRGIDDIFGRVCQPFEEGPRRQAPCRLPRQARHAQAMRQQERRHDNGDGQQEQDQRQAASAHMACHP